MLLSDTEFWDMCPRQIISMLEEKRKIEKEKCKTIGYMAQGGWQEDDGEEIVNVNAYNW